MNETDDKAEEAMDSKPVEEDAADLNLDVKRKWYRKPFWIQTFILALIPIAIILINYVNFMNGLITFWVGLTGLTMGTLFVIFFIGSCMGFLYFFAVTYYTSGITNTIVFAKMFRKKLMIYADTNNIVQHLVPQTNEKSWIYNNIGEFSLEGGKVYWLKNGVVCRLFCYGHSNSINLDAMKDRSILKIDPKVFEDRNRDVRLQAIEDEKSILNPKLIMYIVPIILVIGVAGYLMISVLQDSSCQSDLANLAVQCGTAVKDAQATTTTVTTLPFGIPSMPQLQGP